MLLAPNKQHERVAREIYPEMSDEEIQELLKHIEEERKNDPLLPNETIDRMPAQMMATRMGANLEMGLYICRATGAFPYTNVKFRWKEILSAKQDPRRGCSDLEPSHKCVSASQVQVLGQSRFEVCPRATAVGEASIYLQCDGRRRVAARGLRSYIPRVLRGHEELGSLPTGERAGRCRFDSSNTLRHGSWAGLGDGQERAI